MWLGVRAAASEKLMNFRTNASAPMSCYEHIWPFYFFCYLPKSFMHVHQLMDKINSNHTCFYLQTTPANSRKCNMSHPDVLDKHSRRACAQQEKVETEKIKTGKHLCASTSDRLDTLWHCCSWWEQDRRVGMGLFLFWCHNII